MNMKKSLIVVGVSLVSFFTLSSVVLAESTTCPAGSTAAVCASVGIVTFAVIINLFTATIVKALGTLAMSGAMVAFLYGLVMYIVGAREGDAAKITKGNIFIRWGLVALFVMFSVYGIIKFGQDLLFGGKDMTTITIPNLNFGVGGFSAAGTGSSGSPLGGSPGIRTGSSGSPTGGSPGTGGSSVRPVGGSPNTGSGASPFSGTGSSGNSSSMPTDYASCMEAVQDGATICAETYPADNYSSCVAQGNSSSLCADAFPGNPGDPGGATTDTCGAGWHPDSSNTGCVPDAGEQGSATTQNCGTGFHPDAAGTGCLVDSTGAGAPGDSCYDGGDCASRQCSVDGGGGTCY